MRRSIIFVSLAVFGVSTAWLSSCSGTSNGGDGGNPGNDAGNMGTDSGVGTDAGSMDAGTTDAGTADAGSMDAGETDSGTTDAGMDGGGATSVTVHNFRSWCNISIDGGTFTNSASQLVDVSPGTVPMAMEPENSNFILGLWHHVSGDVNDAGIPGDLDGGKSYASVVVSQGTNACVFVCCPFTAGNGCDPASAPDPCP
jgi:hypothetical protein